MLLWFVFGVFGIVPEVLKCLFFPVLGGFVGWLLLVYFLGLEGLGVFVFLVFLVFVFVVCVAFVSDLFALFLFCCWIVFWCWFLFCFRFRFFVFFCSCFFVLFFCFVFFVFLLFCFFQGFKGQVRWPKGPPHLALNPPLFSFCVFFVFLCFCFLFFLKIGKNLFPP